MITGGARGMGRSHAVALASEGANLVLVDSWSIYPGASQHDLDLTQQLVEEHGGKCLARRADVRDTDALAALVDEAQDTFGRIDILVANAGVAATESIQVARRDVWDGVIGTNLTGVFNALRAVALLMIEQGYLRIVAISSMMGRMGGPAVSAYAASKWGVIGLVKSAAQDLAHFGITVNAVAPGNVDTPMINNLGFLGALFPDRETPTLADAAPFLQSMHLQPQAFLEPADVTAAVMFLVGEGATHMTGAVLDVCAGASARFTA